MDTFPSLEKSPILEYKEYSVNSINNGSEDLSVFEKVFCSENDDYSMKYSEVNNINEEPTSITKNIFQTTSMENKINKIILSFNTKKNKNKFLLKENRNEPEIVNIRNEINFPPQKRNTKIGNTIKMKRKYCSFNIIQKIKNKITKYLIIFINNLIYSLYSNIKSSDNKHTKKIRTFKKLDHNSIAHMIKKDEILQFFDYSINECLSLKVSPKYNIAENYNKKAIEYYLNDENNKDIFDFVLNQLNVEDWIQLYICQKKLENFKGIQTLNKEKINIIKQSLEGIDTLLKEILKDEIEYHCFVLLMYNVRAFLTRKESRAGYKK